MRLPEDELLREFVGDPARPDPALFDPAEALMTGVVQNQDSYMKGRIGQRAFYDRIPVSSPTRSPSGPPDGPPLRRDRAVSREDATEIVVAMGTIADTATAVVDHLR